MMLHFAAPAVSAGGIRNAAARSIPAGSIQTTNPHRMRIGETRPLLVQAKGQDTDDTRLPTPAKTMTQAVAQAVAQAAVPAAVPATVPQPENPSATETATDGEKEGEGEGGEAARPDDGGYLAGGLALGLAPVPVESDFAGEGIVVDLFVDYDSSPGLRLRAGYNRAKSAFGDITLTTSAFYGAYRLPFELAAGWSGVALAGLALMEGELASGPKSLTASTAGVLLGAGVKTVFSNGFELGGRYQLLYGDAEFDGVTVNLGSNQLLLVAAYRFH